MEPGLVGLSGHRALEAVDPEVVLALIQCLGTEDSTAVENRLRRENVKTNSCSTSGQIYCMNVSSE